MVKRAAKARAKIERERKFLVEKFPAGLRKHAHRIVRQGYLAIAGETEVRVRDKGGKYFLTVKRGKDGERFEEEVHLTKDQFARLWRLTGGLRLKKTRYEVPLRGLKIEVDVYRGKLRGLITAEVEFDSKSQAAKFTPTTWLGREITGNQAYSNQSLARRGLPKGTRKKSGRSGFKTRY